MTREWKKDSPLSDGAVLERLSRGEAFGIFCIRLDDDLTVLYGNPLYYRLHGYVAAPDMERAVGNRICRCIHPENLDPLRETLSAAVARGEKNVSFLTRIVRQDGECRWVYCFAALEPAGPETILYGCLLDVTEQKNREEELRVRSEEFRLVAAQSGKYVMRYDIGTGEVFRYYSVGKVFDIPEENEDCPSCLAESDAVAPESAEHYRAFFAAMRRGDPSGSCNLKLRCADGELRWYRWDFTMIYGRDGAPQSAVVALFDNTEQREKELAYEKWQNTLSAMLAESAVYMEVNLTRDTVERRQGSAAYRAWDVPEHTLGAFVEYSAQHFVAPDDLAAYRVFFDHDRLIELCLGGIYEDNLEFRVLGEENGTQWFRVNVQMVKYPYSNDVKAFVVFTDIDRRRRELDRLARLASCDALTGLLNRDATERRITDILRMAGEGDTFALYMIDLDNFKQVNDTLGHRQGDKLLKTVAAAIGEVFRASDVIGRVGGDEFMVFLTGGATPRLVEKKASALCGALQFAVGGRNCGGMELSASVGAVFCRDAKAGFAELYQMSDTALYKAKKAGKNRYFIDWAGTCPNMDETPAELPISGTVQLKALLECMDGGVELLELADPVRQIYVSPSFSRMMGLSRAGYVLPRPLAEVMVHPSDIAGYEAALREGAARGTVVDHIFRQSPDGKVWYWCHARAVQIPHAESRYPVMIALVTDISALKHAETLLRESYERMRIAFGRTAQLLWEVDVASRTFGIWNLEKQDYDEDKVFRGVPEAFLDGEWVHHESKEAFVAFFRSMLAGKAEDSAAFIVRYFATGQYGWAKLSYRMIFGENGSPVKAIGVLEELPNIFSEQLRFRQEKRLMASLRFSLLAVVEANLTADTVRLLAFSGKSPFSGRTYAGYTEMFEAGVCALFGPEDEAHYRARLSPEALRTAYADGVGFVTAEYRRRSREGNVRWTSSTVTLLRNPVTRELHAFAYLRDIDRRRRWELALPSRAERSGVTHLYTRETSEKMIRSILRKGERAHTLCALALVDIKGIDDILENTGESVADWILFSIGRLFQLLLDSGNVVGQVARGRLILFLPDAVSEIWVQRKIEDTLATVQRLREAASMKERVTFTAGIATARLDRADYETLFVQAAYVCANHADDHSDGAATFGRAVSEERSVPSLAADGSFVQMSNGEEKRPLTADEKEALFQCMSLMLSGSGYDASIKAILRTAGDHYGADRTYVLSLSPDGESVSLTYEWMARGRKSLMRRMTDIPLKKLPIIQKALKSGKIFCRGPSAGSAGPYGFIVVPLLLQKRTIGALCVENPRAHGDETALLLALIPLALRERAKYAGKGLIVGTSSRDVMTGLLGREAYEDSLRSLYADALSSLGVLHMDINGLKSVNETQGHETGDRLILFAAKNLTKIFPHAAVYRVTGHEFTVFVQDITHEAFLGKCARAQEAFDRKYPDRFCLGYTWSDQDFAARKLAENAEEMMRLNKQSYFRALERSGKRGESAAMRALKAALAAGRYVVYIQPKARIRTGEIIGGEALVRYTDPKRGIVVPAEFIGRMEREHIIRELDFYVLEQTLRFLHDWKAAGRRLLPVSVNFSRQTLLDRSALSTVLAIHGRYDIPMDLIEIEITESIGGIERETVAHAVETFRRQGFRLSLDDFGAEYSSMSVLANVPFDSVKLDKSIIGNFVFNSISRSIVESMVKICAGMGAMCIAEGVDSEEQVHGLLEAGCEYAQGYYYNKPLPAEEFASRYLAGAADGACPETAS